jgi:hypothetical protein
LTRARSKLSAKQTGRSGRAAAARRARP